MKFINIRELSAGTSLFVFRYFVPILIPLFLIHADVRRILMESGRVGIAFILACSGTTIGAVVGAKLLDLGLKEGDLAGIFTATYTGGSANYAAVIQSTGFDDASTVSAATAVDNLMSAIFLAALAIMPASRWLMSNFAERTHRETSANDKAQEPRQVTGFSLAAAIAFTLSVVALSDFLVMGLNQWFDSEGFSRLRYVFITLFAVLSATFFPGAMARLHGGQTLGIVLAFVFFAAIAAGADVTKLIGVAPILLLPKSCK